MRFRVSYTVDLNEVIEEIARLVRQTADETSGIHVDLCDVADSLESREPNVEVDLLRIDQVRQALAKVDVKLEESAAMLIGLSGGLEAGESAEEDNEDEKVTYNKKGE